ncbi:uncharacterized protein Dmul_07060 [Desulfococcus multivorans]|nr:uncharacterized protein Dmul_07060 [Desulfococcus multivorans]
MYLHRFSPFPTIPSYHPFDFRYSSGDAGKKWFVPIPLQTTVGRFSKTSPYVRSGKWYIAAVTSLQVSGGHSAFNSTFDFHDGNRKEVPAYESRKLSF